MSASSNISRGQGTFDTVFTDHLILGGNEATRIVTELTDDATKFDLVAAAAILPLLTKINQIIQQIDDSSELAQDRTVMTISTIDRFFGKPDEWSLKGWDISNNVLYGLSSNFNNYARIVNRTAFTKPGIYFLSLEVSSLPSGKLVVCLNDAEILEIEKAGHYGVEVEITDIANDSLRLEVVNLGEEDRVAISYCGLYFITSRFYEYLINKVSSLATIDPSNYVTKLLLREELKKFTAQFEASAGIFNDTLNEHLTADNPHGITLESLGGAASDHTHPQYLDSDVFHATLENTLLNYAKTNHTHTQYINRDEISELVENEVGDRFNAILSIPSAIIINGPQGKLPTRFMRTEISLPTPIILPSQLNTNIQSNFSQVYGIITTNCEEMMTKAADVFRVDSDGVLLPNAYPYTATPLVFRYQLQTHRTIVGYTLVSQNNAIHRWKVFTGNNTFRHQIDELTEDNTYYFENPITTDAIAFALTSGEQYVAGFKITLILQDQSLDKLTVSNKAFTISLPDKGSNRIIALPAVDTERVLDIPQLADDIPCYILATMNKVNDSTTNVDFSGTYIRPEYGEYRAGVEVYTDCYADIERDPISEIESYIHPVYGKLSLLEGISKPNKPLTIIYNKEEISWVTQPGVKKVVIEQEVPNDNCVLCGYMLNWRETDMFRIPITWTLMIVGVDSTGYESTIVVDSVENFFPFYSAEDDDIIYTKSLDLNVKVKKLILTLISKDDNEYGLAINQFIPYFSEYFYSIPENTMYRGIEKTKALCLGYAVHDAQAGWVPTNLCLGKSVTLPVNELNETEPATVYTLPNPFFSTSVTVTVNPYRWNSDQASTAVGQVLSITATEIQIAAITPSVYTATIARSW